MVVTTILPPTEEAIMPVNTKDRPARRTYTVAEWCRSIGISIRTYYKLEERHEAPATFRVGRKVLITLESAEEWLKARGEPQS
jgi:excisionase family DNA binding protein